MKIPARANLQTKKSSDATGSVFIVRRKDHEHAKGELKNWFMSRKYVKKGGNGGVRPNSGRPKKVETLDKEGIAELIRKHIHEHVEVQVIDKATGKIIKFQKPRILAALEMLYQIGHKEKNTSALNAWLDRAIGKPIQPIGGDKNQPIEMRHDISEDSNISKVLGKLAKIGHEYEEKIKEIIVNE